MKRIAPIPLGHICAHTSDPIKYKAIKKVEHLMSRVDAMLDNLEEDVSDEIKRKVIYLYFYI
jgi:hypothetical protein